MPVISIVLRPVTLLRPGQRAGPVARVCYTPLKTFDPDGRLVCIGVT